jgi:hypothetical protein
MRSTPTRLATTLLALLVCAATAASAAAGEFTVAQCDARNRDFADARFDRTDGAYYGLSRGCEKPAESSALKVDNLASAPTGAEGRIAWLAPAGLRVVGVSAAARLRADAGHRARLSYLDAAGEQAGRIAAGLDQPGGFQRHTHRLEGVGRAGFATQLICVSGVSCAHSEQARAWIRDVRLTLRDGAAPTVGLSGSLVDSGWLRGERDLVVAADDVGGGLRRLDVGVGGAAVGIPQPFQCALTSAGGVARTMSPCPRARSVRLALGTGAAPFADGANRLTVCARDFGSPANRTCLDRRVLIDNGAPEAAFRGRTDRDPELISASVSDAHSGLAALTIEYRRLPDGPWVRLETEPVEGGVRGRVDSSAPSPGRYLFRLRASDAAGNSVTVSRRPDGRPMVLDFPLRERTLLRSRIRSLGHRVAYGARPRVSGRLGTGAGEGVAGATLRLRERYEPGSRPRLRGRTVTTGSGGRFSARLPRGPSRTLEIDFAGSAGYLPSAARPRKLSVAGIAKLRLLDRRVAAGGRTRFRGRVGARGARIPAPGKVVELQAREAGSRRFRTVGKAVHTGRRGRIRTVYRFRRFYRHPTRFQFRLKVTRQAGWPYRAPTHSRPVSVTVVPR